jgi:hypothetical protein
MLIDSTVRVAPTERQYRPMPGRSLLARSFFWGLPEPGREPRRSGLRLNTKLATSRLATFFAAIWRAGLHWE